MHKTAQLIPNFQIQHNKQAQYALTENVPSG